MKMENYTNYVCKCIRIQCAAFLYNRFAIVEYVDHCKVGHF